MPYSLAACTTEFTNSSCTASPMWFIRSFSSLLSTSTFFSFHISTPLAATLGKNPANAIFLRSSAAAMRSLADFMSPDDVVARLRHSSSVSNRCARTLPLQSEQNATTAITATCIPYLLVIYFCSLMFHQLPLHNFRARLLDFCQSLPFLSVLTMSMKSRMKY